MRFFANIGIVLLVGFIEYLQDIGLPKLTEQFSLGQWVCLIIGSWFVVSQQASMIIYFRSAWITNAYGNSGTGDDKKDTKLELHEVREVKKDLFQFETKTVFTAMVFTIPLLESGQIYPVTVIAIIGTGTYGNTVLNLFEKGKRIIKGEKVKTETGEHGNASS